jgi:DNA-binding NtrC family response regulator/tetratricopeptide (TPR) repeat protein
MSYDKVPRSDVATVLQKIDDLLSRARFTAALEVIAGFRAGRSVPEALDTPLLLARCRALLGLGRWKEVADAAEKKLSELYALRPDEKRSLLEFHIAAGRAVWRLGRPSRAEEHFRAAYHISRWEFDDAAGMLRSRNLLGLCFLGAGEIHRAVGEFARGQTQAREAGLVHEEASFSLNLSIALGKNGRLLEADKELARARTLFAERGHSRGKVQARLFHGYLARIRGDAREAEHEAQGALSEAEEHGFERERVIALEYLGDLALDRHDNQGAVDNLEQAFILAERIAPEGDLIPELCRRTAEVHVRIGEPNRALVACERGLRVARTIHDRFEEAATQRVMAMAHLLLGHREKAARIAQEGAMLLRKLEANYELMRLLVWTGEMLVAGGDAEERREGRDALWEARSLSMAMKLDRWLERIERDLGVEIAPTAGPAPADHALDCSHPSGADPGSCHWGIITQDPRMIELLAILERASSSRLPILILGESGTGKELLARAAHGLSDRAPRPFVVGHCAALSDGLLDVELFGKDPGEGPGGDGVRTGLFETANRGVMFLDEVGELLTSAQAKLLRVIEMGELRRVGGMGVRQVDVRVIVASTRDLGSLVRRGLFRDDLYYRLNGIRLEVPPLRERPGDIGLIGRHLLDRACLEAGKRVTLSEEAWARLIAHPWPGNVSELKSVMDRTVALAGDGERLSAEEVHFQPTVRAPISGTTERTGVRTLRRSGDPEERNRIVDALRANGGNQSEAARSLNGMKRTTLLYKMKKLDIRPEEYRPAPPR